MKNKGNIGTTLVVIIISAFIFVFGGPGTTKREPNTYYAVYVDGKKIGMVDSETKFEDYINTQEEKLKEKYGVDTIYTPKGVEVKKLITYDNNVDSYDDIYRKLVNNKSFTIKGVVITISDKDNSEFETKQINVVDKKLFDDAVIEIIKVFVDDEKYQAFMDDNQEKISYTGSNIEDIYIREDVTYREDYISTNDKIFFDVDELEKYLLYSSLAEQDTYVVKAGDTIETVAEANKLNVQEFLIANPMFTSKNNLLYESQVVSVGLINPMFSIVEEVHSVEEQDKRYTTEVKYDENLVLGYNYVEREGENGLELVTKKYQYVNGLLVDATVMNSEEVKPSVSEILVKGEKYVPNVADLSYWAWPTRSSYVITTNYEYRWGSFHAAIDIAGTGYGSPVYASNNGTVIKIYTGCVPGVTMCNYGNGNYIVIDHNIGGYTTQYNHLKDIYVKEGLTVQRGQQIATVGNTGWVDPLPTASNPLAGVHLHFEVRRYGNHINPFSLFR